MMDGDLNIGRGKCVRCKKSSKEKSASYCGQKNITVIFQCFGKNMELLALNSAKVVYERSSTTTFSLCYYYYAISESMTKKRFEY